jgi:hypothetical protein
MVCQSVIEHGVDVTGYFHEAARLLRPGGLLITSTDFWCEPVPTDGLEAFGQPVKVFTPAGVQELLSASASAGFEQTGPLDLDCGEAAVHWLELDYTFVVLTLRRSNRGHATTEVPGAPSLR